MDQIVSTATANKAPNRTKDYYPFFDYIRAAAAIGVFFVHAGGDKYLPNDSGNFFVQVFFALSGYLIGRILLRTSARDLPHFYFNRSLRIWIPYAIAIFVLFAVTALKQGLNDPKFFEFFFYMLTFVYNWFGPPQLAAYVHRMPLDGTANHFWSICVEEQFYLLAPFIIVFAKRAISIAILVSVIALNFLLPHYYSSIALGVLLAMSNKERLFACLSLGGAIILFPFFGYEQWAPFLAAAIIGFLSMRGEQTAIGRVIGGASYSFYLNHWIGLFAIGFALKQGVGNIASYSLGFAVSSGISLLHYRWIDSQIALRRSDLFTVSRGKAACIAGFSLVSIGLVVGLYLTVSLFPRT
jgi:peptidoglycan/LPS O-acetylase OafA/YrhL